MNNTESYYYKCEWISASVSALMWRWALKNQSETCQIEIRKQSDLEKLAMTLWFLYPNKLLIADPSLERRLEFRAKYDVKCATIADDISRAAIRATSEHNYKQILEICRNENQPG